MNNTGKILIGITAGAAVGAMMGIMFAPEKGSTTRQKWFRRGQEYLDEAKDTFDDLKDTASEMKDTASEFVKRGKQRAEKIQKDAPSM